MNDENKDLIGEEKKKKALPTVTDDEVNSGEHSHSSHHSHSGEKRRKPLAFVEEETAEKKIEQRRRMDPRIALLAVILCFALLVGGFVFKKVRRIYINRNSHSQAVSQTTSGDEEEEHHFGKRYTEENTEGYSATYYYEEIDVDATTRNKKTTAGKDEEDKSDKEKSTTAPVTDKDGKTVTQKVTDVDPATSTTVPSDKVSSRIPHSIRESTSKVLRARTRVYYNEANTASGKTTVTHRSSGNGSKAASYATVILEICDNGVPKEKVTVTYADGIQFTMDDAVAIAQSKGYNTSHAEIIADEMPIILKLGNTYNVIINLY